MQERRIDTAIVLDILDGGTLKMKDDTHFWAYKAYPGRADNMLCVAAIDGASIIVKTFMHHFAED